VEYKFRRIPVAEGTSPVRNERGKRGGGLYASDRAKVEIVVYG
jgi:hypothetical protein